MNLSTPCHFAIGGWIQGNWKQLYIQFAYVCAVLGYTFVVTTGIAKLFDIIPGLSLRAPDSWEEIGMDDAEVSISVLYSSFIMLMNIHPYKRIPRFIFSIAFRRYLR